MRTLLRGLCVTAATALIIGGALAHQPDQTAVLITLDADGAIAVEVHTSPMTLAKVKRSLGADAERLDPSADRHLLQAYVNDHLDVYVDTFPVALSLRDVATDGQAVTLYLHGNVAGVDPLRLTIVHDLFTDLYTRCGSRVLIRHEDHQRAAVFGCAREWLYLELPSRGLPWSPIWMGLAGVVVALALVRVLT